MNTRQAKWLFAASLILYTILTACSPQSTPVSIPTLTRTTVTQTPKSTREVSAISTSTPPGCLRLPGRIEDGSLDTFQPAQKFRVYLPPCYDDMAKKRYPVLYLLHGQTYTDDQWIRLGVTRTLDRLIHAGQVQPFIIVFPDDRYWNLQAGTGFGDRLVENIIPYIDASYRTVPDRGHRAIGGLSRGAGWALQLGLTRWDLFGSIGLHSLAVKNGDASLIGEWIGAIPLASRPGVYMDIGDNDQELEMAEQVEAQFNDAGLAHEWHLYRGAHTEKYWSAHVEEYLRWYADKWNQPQ